MLLSFSVLLSLLLLLLLLLMVRIQPEVDVDDIRHRCHGDCVVTTSLRLLSLSGNQQQQQQQQKYYSCYFLARDSMLSALCYRPSVCHTGGSVKNG